MVRVGSHGGIAPAQTFYLKGHQYFTDHTIRTGITVTRDHVVDYGGGSMPSDRVYRMGRIRRTSLDDA